MKRFILRGVIVALVLMSNLLMVSVAGAASGFTGPYELQNWSAAGPGTPRITSASGFTGPYELQNWSAAGPGTTSITPAPGSTTSATFHYALNPAGFGAQSWQFSTTAAADDTVGFNWAYSGYHANFDVRAGLVAFADGPGGRATTTLVSAGPQNCCTPPSGGFNYSGATTLAVHSGYPFGLIATGDNHDYNNVLQGAITLTNFQAPDRALTVSGFFQPVDMGGVVNTVKGGSTVPLKFMVSQAGVAQTSTSVVASFTQREVACGGSSAIAPDDIIVTTGGTSLRYDATAGQFIQNWQTPKLPGTCYVVTVTLVDGTAISANFMLK